MFELKDVLYKNIIDIDHLIIPSKKITCILGKSGSGKTTLLKLLNKMISPNRGTILYQNKNIKEINPIILRREVVMLPQNPVVYEGSIRENLLKGLSFSDKPLLDDKALNKILCKIKLEKDLECDSIQLSGGEKQRLAIGRVLAMKPKILLLDEPSSALDEDTEEAMIKKILEEAKDNKMTIIMVTHSTKIANNFADHILKI